MTVSPTKAGVISSQTTAPTAPIECDSKGKITKIGSHIIRESFTITEDGKITLKTISEQIALLQAGKSLETQTKDTDPTRIFLDRFADFKNKTNLEIYNKKSIWNKIRERLFKFFKQDFKKYIKTKALQNGKVFVEIEEKNGNLTDLVKKMPQPQASASPSSKKPSTLTETLSAQPSQSKPVPTKTDPAAGTANPTSAAATTAPHNPPTMATAAPTSTVEAATQKPPAEATTALTSTTVTAALTSTVEAATPTSVAGAAALTSTVEAATPTSVAGAAAQSTAKRTALTPLERANRALVQLRENKFDLKIMEPTDGNFPHAFSDNDYTYYARLSIITLREKQINDFTKIKILSKIMQKTFFPITADTPTKETFKRFLKADEQFQTILNELYFFNLALHYASKGILQKDLKKISPSSIFFEDPKRKQQQLESELSKIHIDFFREKNHTGETSILCIKKALNLCDETNTTKTYQKLDLFFNRIFNQITASTKNPHEKQQIFLKFIESLKNRTDFTTSPLKNTFLEYIQHLKTISSPTDFSFLTEFEQHEDLDIQKRLQALPQPRTLKDLIALLYNRWKTKDFDQTDIDSFFGEISSYAHTDDALKLYAALTVKTLNETSLDESKRIYILTNILKYAKDIDRFRGFLKADGSFSTVNPNSYIFLDKALATTKKETYTSSSETFFKETTPLETPKDPASAKTASQANPDDDELFKRLSKLRK